MLGATLGESHPSNQLASTRKVPVRTALAAALVALGALASPVAWAQGAPSPAPLPSPSPTPTPGPRPGTIRLTGSAHVTFLSSSAAGPGVTAAEAAGFAGGSPLSPLTPYDTFSSAPLINGNGGESALYLIPTYSGKTFDAGLMLGAGAVAGSVTTTTFWGEPLFPALNPHLGAQTLPYRITFPAHAGGDDGNAFAASVLSGSLASKDGAFVLRGGWFDLAQSDAFVFTQPAAQNAIPSIGFATAETLGEGAPNLDSWTPGSAVLPLHGIDAVGKHGLATLEVTDATLPSLPGTGARLTFGSLAIDHGEGTRYSFDLAHVSTGGEPVATTVLFGIGAIIATPQGPLPSTTVGGQQQTILGARAAFHVTPALDAVLEYGRSRYGAQAVAEPGTGHPGTYEHAGLAHPFGPASVGLDVYRNDPYYATAILPYGIPENVWSIAWSWPGQWLKSNYQLIDNSPVNVDRQGYRVHAQTKTPALDLRVSFANFGEIVPITLTNAQQTGFIDGFFLPQPDAAATFGHQHQYALYANWQAPFANVSFDYAEDTMNRPGSPGNPQDLVSYDTPEYVLAATRRIGRSLVANAGYGRYAMRGSFAQPYTNVDFVQHVGMAGFEWRWTSRASTLISARRSAFAGLPPAPLDPSPNFTATVLTLEQRYAF